MIAVGVVTILATLADDIRRWWRAIRARNRNPELGVRAYLGPRRRTGTAAAVVLILTGSALTTHLSHSAGHSDARAVVQEIATRLGTSAFAHVELTMPVNPHPPVRDFQADLQSLIELDIAAVGLRNYPTVKVSILDSRQTGTVHEFSLAADTQRFCLRITESGAAVPQSAEGDSALVYGYEIPISTALSDGQCTHASP